jgi:hypothetical protein
MMRLWNYNSSFFLRQLSKATESYLLKYERREGKVVAFENLDVKDPLARTDNTLALLKYRTHLCSLGLVIFSYG